MTTVMARPILELESRNEGGDAHTPEGTDIFLVPAIGTGSPGREGREVDYLLQVAVGAWRKDLAQSPQIQPLERASPAIGHRMVEVKPINESVNSEPHKT